MNVDSINLLTQPLVNYMNANNLAPDDIKQPFEYFFDSYAGLLKQTNAYQQTADQAQLDFASGKTDDMLSVMLAQEKAYSALSFTVQLTNKIVDAYKQVMQLQL